MVMEEGMRELVSEIVIIQKLRNSSFYYWHPQDVVN